MHQNTKKTNNKKQNSITGEPTAAHSQPTEQSASAALYNPSNQNMAAAAGRKTPAAATKTGAFGSQVSQKSANTGYAQTSGAKAKVPQTAQNPSSKFSARSNKNQSTQQNRNSQAIPSLGGRPLANQYRSATKNNLQTKSNNSQYNQNSKQLKTTPGSSNANKPQLPGAADQPKPDGPNDINFVDSVSPSYPEDRESTIVNENEEDDFLHTVESQNPQLRQSYLHQDDEQNNTGGEVDQNQINVNEFQTCDPPIQNVMSNNSMKQFIEKQQQQLNSQALRQGDFGQLQNNEGTNNESGKSQPQSQQYPQGANKQQNSQNHQEMPSRRTESLYQFIVPVAQLNLNSQVSVVQNSNIHHGMGGPINNQQSPMNANHGHNLQFQIPRHNKSQAMGANQGRFARDVRYASNSGGPLLMNQQELPETASNNQYQFTQMDSITNYEGRPRSTISSQMPTQHMYAHQNNLGQLNFLSYGKKVANNIGPQNQTQRTNQNYQNSFTIRNQNPQTQRASGNVITGELSHFRSEEIYKNRIRQVNENKLKLIVHSAQIEIPQSIKLVAQGIYAPLVCTQDKDVLKVQQTQTDKKCKVDLIRNSHPANLSEVKQVKIADFKDQELLIDIYSESDIQYSEGHIQYFGQIYKNVNHNSSKQKCSLKLLAVSDDKQKLIGVYNYHFHAKLHQGGESQSPMFEPLNRQTIKFQKSIDKNASICISTELTASKLYTQNDYDKIFNNFNTQTQQDHQFVSADDMGVETLISQGSGNQSDEGKEVIQGVPTEIESSPEMLTKQKSVGVGQISSMQRASEQKSISQRSNQEAGPPNSLKRGINKINTSHITAMKLRGPLAAENGPKDEKNLGGPEETVATIYNYNHNNLGLNEEKEGSKSDTQDQTADDFRCRPQSAAQPQTQSIKQDDVVDRMRNIPSPQQLMQQDLMKQPDKSNTLQSPDPPVEPASAGGENNNNQQMQIQQFFSPPTPKDGQDNISTNKNQNSHPLKSTMTMFFEKIQTSVHSVKKALDENQREYDRKQNIRRSQSTNGPFNRFRFEAHRYQNTKQNSALKQNAFRQGPEEEEKAQAEPLRQTTTEIGTLKNEVATVLQEKEFLKTRLESQQNQYEEQIKLLHEKIQHQEKKYNKRKQSVNEMKMRLEQEMKNYIQIQERNENEFKDEYEYMIHLYQHNNQLKDMFEQKYHEVTNEKLELEERVKRDEEMLRQNVIQEKAEVQRTNDEKEEAYEQKISIQQEEIQALANEKQNNAKIIDNQMKEIISNKQNLCKMQDQIKELQEQLQEKEEKYTTQLKDTQEDSQLREKELRVIKDQYLENEEANLSKLKALEESKADLESKLASQTLITSSLEEKLTRQQEQILAKDKQVFKLQNDIQQQKKAQTQRQQMEGKSQEAVNDLKEQNAELMERLRITESQLIQVKSSWAESEHEREQFFNQIQDQEEHIFALQEQVNNMKKEYEKQE